MHASEQLPLGPEPPVQGLAPLPFDRQLGVGTTALQRLDPERPAFDPEPPAYDPMEQRLDLAPLRLDAARRVLDRARQRLDPECSVHDLALQRLDPLQNARTAKRPWDSIVAPEVRRPGAHPRWTPSG